MMGYYRQTNTCILGVIAILVAFASSFAWAGPLSTTNTWSSGDTLNAADLNQNFTDTELAVTDNDSRITAVESQVGGVEFASSSLDINVTTTASTVMSVAVTAPTSGFVIVSFSSTVRVNHVNGTTDYVRLWLATSATSNTFDETWRYHRVGSAALSDTYWQTMHSQNVFPVNAGTTTFYARGDSGASGGIFRNTTLHAIFVPNRY